jgi:hypothetical protein
MPRWNSAGVFMRGMPYSIQRPLEAAAATALGATILYWFAPLPSYNRGVAADADVLAAMFVGAIFGGFFYFCLRALDRWRPLERGTPAFQIDP